MKVARNLLLAACTVGLGLQPAMALETSIGPEFRTDLVFNNSDLDDDEDPNDETKSTEFRIARARVNFRTKLNDTTSFRARVRFNRSFQSNGYDNTSSGLQYWYITRQLGESVSLTVGKQFAYIGSIENDYSGMDVYQYSQGPVPAAYEVGATLSFDVAGQTIAGQLLNSPEHQDNQTIGSMAKTIAWYGDFDFGAVKLSPIVTLGLFPSEKQETGGLEETDAYTTSNFSYGTRVFLMNKVLQFDIEGRNVTTPEYDETDDTGADNEVLENTWDTIVYAVYFNHEMIRPFFKGYQDDHDNDGDDVADYSGQSFGVEFFPDRNGKKTYRVHAVYTTDTVDPDAGDEVTTSTINLGVAASWK
jgi:hypothetical protein